ncbi:MAG: sigma-70 family RNA polymerase sigma factor [Cellulosimicrobium funkei]|uniref:DNA-directed RNA polymerase sigma-70 factor n=1 Tax=Cellulosimicrobium cellulans TaxID=1710 RepID=A0AAV5P4T3_CELCE|nr:sigma-70 family RNA polymerase sigma factor [Cellulosimicrobium cellulans]QDP74845.1 sigma-70 family RNA polymerase sigma factor [Cellulosimicrobium cellulans]GLY56132.1 DNA-directed RNA polymerase sigma-70 factor [Cellulosimicrobium cellulans]
MNLSERNALVVDNLALVGFLVSDLCARADHLSREDLASVGAVALTTAATSFDPTRGVPFGAYARRRIVGALADELRSQDWAPRSARRRIKALTAVTASLTASFGREPTDAQVAEAMGVAVADVRAARDDAGRSIVAMEDTTYDHVALEAPTPEEQVLSVEERHVVREAVAALPDQLRHVVEQVYFAGRSVGDLAAELGISHSTVSHARIEAVRLLREGLEAHYSGREAKGPAAPLTARRREYLAAMGERVAGGATQRSAWAVPAAS